MSQLCGSILDLVFTKGETFITGFDACTPLGRSDHVCIVIELNLGKVKENVQVP